MDKSKKGSWIKANTANILSTHPHLAEFLPFLEVLRAESPRGSVLVAASFLETLLHDVLRSFMIEGKSQDQILSGFNAPAGTFSAKIALAAALGLLTEEERRECELVRKIRNKFAHNVHPTFEDEAVKSLCLELHFRAMPYEGVTMDAKASFITAAVSLAANLTNRAHYVAQERLTARTWKR